MKVRFLIIILTITFSILIGHSQFVQAICVQNLDWPSAPCYGYPDAHPTIEDDRNKWDGYYDYKGAKFMEEKKTEMLEALQNGRLCEWESSSSSSQNYNVMIYYFLTGVISSYDCSLATIYEPEKDEQKIIPTEIKVKIANFCNDVDNISSKDAQDFWNTIHVQLLSLTPEFQMLNGSRSSITTDRAEDSANSLLCGIDSMNGTFTSTKEIKHKYHLEYDSAKFKYQIDSIYPSRYQNVIESPLKQFKKWNHLQLIHEHPENIVDVILCKNNFEIILKHDKTPICVKQETKQKLIERNWTTQNIQDGKTLHLSWQYSTDKRVSSISMSKDNSIIVVGTNTDYTENYIYLFNNSGKLLWNYKIDKEFSKVTISPDSSYIAASAYQIAPGPAGLYSNPSIYLFDIKGNLVWKYDNFDIYESVSLLEFTPDMHVIITTQNKILNLDKQGKIVWTYQAKNDFRGISLSNDGGLIAASDDKNLILLDKNGNNLGNFTQYYDFNYALTISNDSKYVVMADSNGTQGNLYFLNNNGKLLWKKTLPEAIQRLAISDNNSNILGSTSREFMVFDSSGNIKWVDNIPSYPVMSSDGSFFVGTTFNQKNGTNITTFDDKGNIISNHLVDGYGQLLLSYDNKHLVYGTQDTQKIYFFDIDEDPNVSIIDLSSLRESRDLHIKIVPELENSFNVTMGQSQTLQIPWDIKIDKDYTVANLETSIKSLPKIQSIINPVFPFTTINGIPPGGKIITIHSESDTLPGNYTIPILAKGDSIHNEIGWITSLENKTLGEIHVSIIPQEIPVSIVIGTPHYENQNFCVKMDENVGGGQFCQGGSTYQEIPIDIFSDKPTAVHLSSFGVQGGWIKFVPEELISEPNGTHAKMIMAGHLVPFLRNPSGEKPLVIQASSKNYNATAILPVFPGIISVINNVSPIKLNPILTNSNGTNFNVSSVVYDPLDNSTLPVKLSVLGMWENKVVPMPNWLEVNIPDSSFVLESSKPHYFIISAKTQDAPLSGTYEIVINENIGGRDFVELLDITIENRWA